jgi:hypothetical protein
MVHRPYGVCETWPVGIQGYKLKRKNIILSIFNISQNLYPELWYNKYFGLKIVYGYLIIT